MQHEGIRKDISQQATKRRLAARRTAAYTDHDCFPGARHGCGGKKRERLALGKEGVEGWLGKEWLWSLKEKEGCG